MSRSKKALIISGIVLIVGFIGLIPSAAYTIPKLKNQVKSNLENVSIKEKDIATFDKEVETLSINFRCENYSVVLKKSEDKLLHIKTYEDFENNIKLSKDYRSSDKTLIIGTVFNNSFPEGSSMKKGVAAAITRDYIVENNLNKKLIIEVPNGVDIDFINLGSNSKSEVIVTDKSVLKDKFSLKYSQANIKLPYFNNLKSVYIYSYMGLALDLREVVNADKVVLYAPDINICSGGGILSYDVKNIPEKFDIFTRHLEITSFIPIGRNVNMNIKDWAGISMPFDKYNISGKIKNIDAVKLNNLELNVVGGTYEGKYSSYKGEEHKMNINTSEGMLTNGTIESIEGVVNSQQLYVPLDNEEYIISYYTDSFIDKVFRGVRSIVKIF